MSNITIKRKNFEEPTVKPKVLTRPLPVVEEKSPEKTGLALIYKTQILETFDTQAWKFVTIALPAEEEFAAQLLENRLCNQTIDCGSFVAKGEGDGLHVFETQEATAILGKSLGVWTYAALARDLIEFGVIKPAKGKAKSNGKAPAILPTNAQAVAGGEDAWGSIAYAVKVGALEKLLDVYDHVEKNLPADLKAAIVEVRERLRPITHRQEAFVVTGTAEGLEFRAHGGQVLNVWPYDVVTDAIKERAKRNEQIAEPKLAKGKTKIASPPPAAAATGAEAAKQLLRYTSRNVDLPLAQLERHPENRHPAEADVEELAASLRIDGQLENIVVREIAVGRYQIISGETRQIAAKKSGRKELTADVIECDDDEAVLLVALFNSKRKNLNPIQKAQHIELMCRRGKTREEAARAVGLASGSAASNLVRLLKLPKIFQDAVAKEELPESFARALVPALSVPTVIADLERRWKKKADDWDRRCFDSRVALERKVEELVDHFTRRLDKTTRYSDSSKAGSWEACGKYPCLLTKEQIAQHRETLRIVTITVDGEKEVEVATNVELFEKLQYAAIKAKHAAKGKGKAKAAGAKADADESKKLTPAEIKRAKEERAGQLERAIKEWVETVMRREIAAAIRTLKPSKAIDVRILKLMTALVAIFAHQDVDTELGQAFGEKVTYRDDPYEVISRSLASASKDTFCKGCEVTKWQLSARDFCAWAIGGNADDPQPAGLSDSELQALFSDWGCTMDAAWERLYRAKDPLIEQFFQMHRKDELIALMKELLGTYVNESAASKGNLVKDLCSQPHTPKLPKSLQPAKKRGAK